MSHRRTVPPAAPDTPVFWRSLDFGTRGERRRYERAERYAREHQVELSVSDVRMVGILTRRLAREKNRRNAAEI